MNERVLWGFLTFLIAIVVALLIFVAISQFELTKATSVCLAGGYPKAIRGQHTWYCHKLENGNDVIISVNQLESKE